MPTFRGHASRRWLHIFIVAVVGCSDGATGPDQVRLRVSGVTRVATTGAPVSATVAITWYAFEPTPGFRDLASATSDANGGYAIDVRVSRQLCESDAMSISASTPTHFVEKSQPRFRCDGAMQTMDLTLQPRDP